MKSTMTDSSTPDSSCVPAMGWSKPGLTEEERAGRDGQLTAADPVWNELRLWRSATNDNSMEMVA